MGEWRLLPNWLNDIFGSFDSEKESDYNVWARIFNSIGNGPLGLWNALGSGYYEGDWSYDNLSPEYQNMLSQMGLTGDDLTQFLKDNGYYEEAKGFWNRAANAWDGFGGLLKGSYGRYELDEDRLNADLKAMYDALQQRPDTLYAQDYLDAAREQAYAERDAALAELDSVKDTQVELFNDELDSLASSYNTAKSSILSNQYQQNAQLMDTMASQMDKSRRNALEAGASAGLRLAGNINTLLSTQNKQSQISMDTANQLAQMMVNQRNAEASTRRDYGNYMSQYLSDKRGINDSAESKAQSYYDVNYGTAQRDYDTKANEWDSKNSSNPLWEYKSKYSKSTTS